MAHPKLSRRVTRRRTTLATGTAAVLLAAPLAGAAAATGPLDETLEESADSALEESGDATLEGSGDTLEDTVGSSSQEDAEPSSLERAGDPVDEIVDGVLTPNPVPPEPGTVPEVPDAGEATEGVTDAVPDGSDVPDAVESAPDTVEDTLPEPPETVETPEVPPEAPPEAPGVPPELGDPDGGTGPTSPDEEASEPTSTVRTPDRLVASGTPPFRQTTRVASADPATGGTSTVSSPGAVSTPTAALVGPSLPSALSGQRTSTQQSLSPGLDTDSTDDALALAPSPTEPGASSTPMRPGSDPSDDARTWLLTTAGGLLVLVAAGHAARVRRNSATVAR